MNETMEEQRYFEARLDDQISWYDRKSSWNKKWFYTLSVIGFATAALIPFLAALITKHTDLQYVVGALGIVVSITSAVIGLYKFHEHWVQYRTTSEMLKHEKYLYLTRTEPYDEPDPFNKLVERVETLISRENTTWIEYVKPKKKDTE